MGRYILFGLCVLSILAGSQEAQSFKDNMHDEPRDATENYRNIDPPKLRSTKDDMHRSCLHVDQTKDAAKTEGQDSSHSSKMKSEVSVQDTTYAKQIENHDVSRSADEGKSATDLSSHDILLDPAWIPIRQTRQVEKRGEDHRNFASRVSIDATSGNLESVDDEAMNGRTGLPRRALRSLESDIAVAEDRYRPQYPHWHQRQFSNQRYRPDNRRTPYRDYLRYPVFPGR